MHESRTSHPRRPASQVAIFVVTIVVAGGGTAIAGRSSDNFTVAMLVTALWLAAVTIGALLIVRARRRWLPAVGGGLAVVGAALAILVGLPTFIGRTVDEEVVAGTPASAADPAGGNAELLRGTFAPVAHDGTGRAAVVELPDGSRKLTLTGFETDAGPDLRVYLSTQHPTSGNIGDFADLGGLKGNRGDQQYEIPRRLDLGRYRVAVVWCRAFSVPFTAAELRDPTEAA